MYDFYSQNFLVVNESDDEYIISTKMLVNFAKRFVNLVGWDIPGLCCCLTEPVPVPALNPKP